MKKIMFNDKYGLTDAVLKGSKTMTRRISKEFRTGRIIYANEVESIGCYSDENLVEYVLEDGNVIVSVPKYKIGEELAVAQSYKSIFEEMMRGDYGDSKYDAFRSAFVAGTKGWTNKMFVRADLMPYRIKITDIKVERLQDITDEDCLKEGVVTFDYGYFVPNLYRIPSRGVLYSYKTPREAFAALIDRPGVGHKGLWVENPYVFAYTFELLK